MDKMIDSPWVLRITSLALAILLFFSVRSEINSNERLAVNEQEDVIRDVPVEVYYDTDNLIVTGIPSVVDVRIKGPMQDVLKVKASRDFKVFIDLNRLLIGEHKVKLQYENISRKLDVELDPATVDIKIEERVTKEFKVEAEMNRQTIAEGFVLKGLNVTPPNVFITGAKSTIDSISYVKATVAGDNSKEHFTQNADVRVLDKELNKLDVEVNPKTVKVDIDISEYSRDVPITLTQKGKPKSGLQIDDMKAEQRFITVYGTKSIVDAITTIEVPVDVAKFTESKTYNVPITKPEGISKLGADAIKVKVQISKTAEETE
ncbi:YbbR-like protein [Metalysinibacillus saudimassiliensis]|uniref:YbbR-like protein n=1 Tax=Metalysinibacillus saudimassiliensis TaxID=1461583 RepID=A0A078MI41_9BACL|nr:YbbR-like protein [Metalysinibacillus saudimassiliensis]